MHAIVAEIDPVMVLPKLCTVCQSSSQGEYSKDNLPHFSTKIQARLFLPHLVQQYIKSLQIIIECSF